jgi:hypothetical protein
MVGRGEITDRAWERIARSFPKTAVGGANGKITAMTSRPLG